MSLHYMFALLGEVGNLAPTSALWGWGPNSHAALGLTSVTTYSSPVTAVVTGAWTSVATGDTMSAAIKGDGTLWTCGYNTYGQLGDGTTSNRSSFVQVSGGGTNWQQVGVGLQTAAAVKSDGTLWTWGIANYNGTSYAGTYSSPVTIAGGGTNWSQVSIGGLFGAAVKTDGTMWVWGDNATGCLGTGQGPIANQQIGSPITTINGGTNWKQVACGYYNTVAAVKTDGTLWTCGYNNNYQLGNAGGNTSSFVTTMGGGTNWSQVSAGWGHMSAIKTDGTLWSWGYNTFGQIGNGSATNVSSPVTNSLGGTNWKQVACGYGHTIAIKTDGTMWACGDNNQGQLGINNPIGTGTSAFTLVAGGITSWKQASTQMINTMGVD